MLKVCLIGAGCMGRIHLECYSRLESEGFSEARLAAVCDVDAAKFEGAYTPGNIESGNTRYNFKNYALYTDINEMLHQEKPDIVDICLPSFLHAEVSVKCLQNGINVLCEKPMSLSTGQCDEMMAASIENGKKLMIGQCLRFWPEYVYLKECVDSGKYGRVIDAYFFRGGGTPGWSGNNWYTDREKSGGCMFDLHVHDVDMVSWLFGRPDGLSCTARNVIPGSGYDVISTNYIYDDGKVVNGQANWTLGGGFGFEMRYRVNFEKANLVYQGGSLKVNINDGDSFLPDFKMQSAYYKEIRYFIECVAYGREPCINLPQSSMQTIAITEAEVLSADNKGAVVTL